MFGLFGKSKKDPPGGEPKAGTDAEKTLREEPEKQSLKTRNDAVTVQAGKAGSCTVNTAMATHIGTRSYQQDAAYVCEPVYDGGIAFGILCDGMGGMECGEEVSSDVVSFMANRIAAMKPDEDVPAFFERAAVEANELILERNLKAGQEAGTTLIAALVRGSELYWLSVGDSRIYIIRGGDMVQVTKDHNFALELQEMVDAGRITQQQADQDPRRDALVSYIGAPVLERVDLNPGYFELQYGDLVLLCSDGLTKALSDERILGVIKENGYDIVEMARVLPLTAFDEAKGGLDNTSVILMQYFGTALV